MAEQKPKEKPVAPVAPAVTPLTPEEQLTALRQEIEELEGESIGELYLTFEQAEAWRDRTARSIEAYLKSSMAPFFGGDVEAARDALQNDGGVTYVNLQQKVSQLREDAFTKLRQAGHWPSRSASSTLLVELLAKL